MRLAQEEAGGVRKGKRKAQFFFFGGKEQEVSTKREQKARAENLRKEMRE